MTKEVITRGWLRDALDKALSEDTAEPTPVQQFIAAILHGNTIEAPSEYRGSKYGKPDTAKRLDSAILDVLIFSQGRIRAGGTTISTSPVARHR